MVCQEYGCGDSYTFVSIACCKICIELTLQSINLIVILVSSKSTQQRKSIKHILLQNHMTLPLVSSQRNICLSWVIQKEKQKSLKHL